jgi:hypothetical protein
MEVAGQSWPRRGCGVDRGAITPRLPDGRPSSFCNLQFAICNLQSLFRRELFSRIRAIRVTGPRRLLLFNGKPKALPPAARPTHATSSLSVGHEPAGARLASYQPGTI